ncbi:MAG: hypothetical protein D6712_09670 [Chloroflexi bacterium]|nr:MAG: hypothetical protein D6712_09670 [Chloroflexota bacterium]
MSYQIALGYNNTVGLTPLQIQPRFFRFEYPLVRPAGDGTLYADGLLSGQLQYNALLSEHYELILSQFGLSFGSAMSSQITIALPRNDDRSFGNYNAIAWYPIEARYESGAWRDVVIQLTNLEAV